MKRLFICTLILISINVMARNNRNSNTTYSDSTIANQILMLSLHSYIGKPVDSLLKILPANYSNRGFMPAGIGFAKGIFQGYGLTGDNSCSVEIFIDTFQFLPIPNRTSTELWNMELAKKETIAYIKVYKNDRCIYQCDSEKYY